MYENKTEALKGIAITRDVEDLFLPDLNFLITSNQTDTAATKEQAHTHTHTHTAEHRINHDMPFIVQNQ